MIFSFKEYSIYTDDIQLLHCDFLAVCNGLQSPQFVDYFQFENSFSPPVIFLNNWQRLKLFVNGNVWVIFMYFMLLCPLKFLSMLSRCRSALDIILTAKIRRLRCIFLLFMVINFFLRLVWMLRVVAAVSFTLIRGSRRRIRDDFLLFLFVFLNFLLGPSALGSRAFLTDPADTSLCCFSFLALNNYSLRGIDIEIFPLLIMKWNCVRLVKFRFPDSVLTLGNTINDRLPVSMRIPLTAFPAASDAFILDQPRVLRVHLACLAPFRCELRLDPRLWASSAPFYGLLTWPSLKRVQQVLYDQFRAILIPFETFLILLRLLIVLQTQCANRFLPSVYMVLLLYSKLALDFVGVDTPACNLIKVDVTCGLHTAEPKVLLWFLRLLLYLENWEHMIIIDGLVWLHIIIL